ncbi:hypothetical protein [Novosphingobium sp. JCM 18896]|uniref:hypothetical protein n=1 Tax=Novosphingobium sp. JCM 18896 TaxID=2989731 RepID=UPI002221C012|nr:hypothetical protein [Novosphingobium sp. JCM 18896]MCW1430145.1 hypothetical protein [Novosphingobium sp. JCM 18896]
MAKSERSLAAAERLVETAERLIGELGLDRASAREISRAAGQKNNYAVQYHFGDFVGLIQAIRARRLPDLERHRAELLAAVRAQGREGDLRALTEVLYLPLIELRGADGERRFARFVLAMLSSPDIERFGEGLVEAMPVGSEVLELIQAARPDLPMALIHERQRLIAILVLTSVFNRRPPYDAPANDGAAIENALAMAAAALAAPVGPSLAAVLG